ncbi:MAG: universal stress protein, partial [Bacteroidota bacterium]
MIALDRVLFPTDDAPCADRAFAHAAFLADHLGATLEVLRLKPVTGTEPGTPHRYETPDGVARVDTTRQVASVPEAIVEAAREADLVVMGTHGRRGLRRAVVGSTTEHVLHHLDCPVLAVGVEAARETPTDVDRILVPTDFSASSAVALTLADGLAALYDAHVDLLHAVHLPNLPEVYGLGSQLAASVPEVRARTEAALGSLARRYIDPARLGAIEVSPGPPAAVILEAADRLGAGLLVMPTHGRTGLERLALGSVAESVLRRAPCAVLAIPSYGRFPLTDAADVPRPVARPRPEA